MKCVTCSKEFKNRGKICVTCRVRKHRDVTQNTSVLHQEKTKPVITQKKDELETFGKGQNGEDMLYCEECLFHVMRYCKNWHDCKHYLKDYDITGVKY